MATPLEQPNIWKVDAPKMRARRYKTFDRAAKMAVSQLVKHGLAWIIESGGWMNLTVQVQLQDGHLTFGGRYTEQQRQTIECLFDQVKGGADGNAA